MNPALTYLYHILEIDLDTDEPALVINDSLTIYFEVDEYENLLFRCIVMPLPTDVFSLKQILQLNYGNSIQLGANLDDEHVLAVYCCKEESEDNNILDQLCWFINNILAIQKSFSCPANLSSELNLLQGILNKHKID